MKPSFIHICGVRTFKAGDPAPEGYLEWHEWAQVQSRAGLKSQRRKCCGRWKFPQEKCDHAAAAITLPAPESGGGE